MTTYDKEFRLPRHEFAKRIDCDTFSNDDDRELYYFAFSNYLKILDIYNLIRISHPQEK